MLQALVSVAEKSKCSVTIVDMDKTDRPLIFINQAFTQITGYSYSESVGRNCRFLQGEKTDLKSAQFIRDCLNERTACCVDILNYKKDRTTFWNRLILLPFVENEKTYFIGLQNDVTEKHKQKTAIDVTRIHESEISHKINNPLSIALGYEGLLNTQKFTPEKRKEIEKILQDAIERIDDYVLNIENISEFENFKYF